MTPWHAVKLWAVIGIIVLNVDLWGRLYAADLLGVEPGLTDAHRPIRYVLVGWMLAGILVLIIDSARRNYEGPKTTPLALAIAGVLSFGITSFIYYLMWGRCSLLPAASVYGTDFCENCVATSDERSAGNTATVNWVIGTRLIGNADRCEVCGSRVKTLWAWAVIPLAPFGSYRVLPVAEARYLSRRTSLNWWQVISVYLFGLSIGVPVLYWILMSTRRS